MPAPQLQAALDLGAHLGLLVRFVRYVHLNPVRAGVVDGISALHPMETHRLSSALNPPCAAPAVHKKGLS